MTVFKDSEDLSHCLDCKKPTVWVRRTQFCGNHPYCDEHARRQGDFGHEDPSYFFWDCVAPQRLPAGEDLAAEMAADPEFVRCAEEGWQAIDEGCCRRITDLEVEGLHFVKDGEVFSGQEARKVGGDPPQEVMATASQCWALEVGGDRCGLRAGHPGPHMGGHHTFEHLLPEEEVASVLGSTIDILQSECGRLRAEVERWQLRFAEADQAVLRLTADLARMTAERDGLRDMVRQYQEQWDNEVAWGLALRRECGARDEETMPRFAARLSRERDALLAAAKMALDGHRKFEDHLGTKIDGPPWIRALRAAVAACAPPASGEEG